MADGVAAAEGDEGRPGAVVWGVKVPSKPRSVPSGGFEQHCA